MFAELVAKPNWAINRHNKKEKNFCMNIFLGVYTIFGRFGLLIHKKVGKLLTKVCNNLPRIGIFQNKNFYLKYSVFLPIGICSKIGF